MANRRDNPYGGPVDRHGNPLTTKERSVYMRDPATGQIRLMNREQFFRAYPDEPPEAWHQLMDPANAPPTQMPNGDTPMSRLEGSGGTNYLAGGAGDDRVSATGAWLPGKTKSSAELFARMQAEAAAAQPEGLTGMEGSPEMAGQIPPSYGGPPRFFGGPGDGDIGPPSPLTQYQREQLAAAVQQRASAPAGVGSGRPSYPAPNSPSGTSGIRGLANAVVGAPGALGNAIFGPGGPVMNASQAVNGWLGDLTAPATAALPPPTGNGGVPAAAPVAPMSRTITRDDIAAALASAGGDHSYGGDYPQNYITSGGGQSANAPWTTPTAAPAYTGGVPFKPPATSPASGGPVRVATSSVGPDPMLAQQGNAVDAATRGAGGYGGYDPLSSAYVPIAPAVLPAAGDPAPPPAVDTTGLSVGDTGYPDRPGPQQPHPETGPLGAVKLGIDRPLSGGRKLAVGGVAAVANSIAPGFGMLINAIGRSLARGTLDNAHPYTGGPVTSYNRTGTSPFGSAVYGAPYGATGYSNSMFTPTASGWHAPSYSSVSGGPSYAYNPLTHTYVDSRGNEHPY